MDSLSTVHVPNEFLITSSGLQIVGNPTFEQWAQCGSAIRQYGDSIHLAIGDWLNYGEIHYAKTYQEIAKTLNFAYKTIKNDKYVTDKVPQERRVKGLTFGHFDSVAPLEAEEQEKYLKAAVDEKMSVQALRTYIHEHEEIEENTKDLSRHRDLLPQTDGDNELAVKEAELAADTFMEKLNNINYTTLSGKVKKEFLTRLMEVERRCAGIEMEYGD